MRNAQFFGWFFSRRIFSALMLHNRQTLKIVLRPTFFAPILFGSSWSASSLFRLDSCEHLHGEGQNNFQKSAHNSTTRIDSSLLPNYPNSVALSKVKLNPRTHLSSRWLYTALLIHLWARFWWWGFWEFIPDPRPQLMGCYCSYPLPRHASLPRRTAASKHCERMMEYGLWSVDE